MVHSIFRALAFATLSSRCEARLFGPAPGPAPAPGSGSLPPATDVITNFDKTIRQLPEQGYDERSQKDWVQHKDFDTALGDWQSERPRRRGEMNDGDSTTRACEEHPEYLWCNLYLKDRNRRNKGPRVVHQVVKVTKEVAAGGGGERVAERVARQQHDTEQEVKNKLKGMDKGLDETDNQALEVTDQMSGVLPPGMWPSEKQANKSAKDKEELSKEHGGDFPPGMVSKEGGPTPHDPVAFHARSMTDLR